MFVYELSGCGFESSCSHLNKTVVWKKGNIKLDEALRLAKINPESFHSMIWRCASKLRNDIFAVQSKQTCEPVTVDNITGRETLQIQLKASLKCFAQEIFQQLKNIHQKNFE